MAAVARPTLVILSQVYVPDPAAVGQHLHEVAREAVARGFRVRVLTSARGYDDPSQRYPHRETRDGVEVERIPLGSLGKASMGARLVGGAAFLAQACARALAMRRIDRLLISTSPPIVGPAGVLLQLARRAPLTFWVMDINPDQAVEEGQLSANALPVRALDRAVVETLRRAERVVTLDRFMAARLERKQPLGTKLAVIPPWSLAEQERPELAPRQSPFRRAHGIGDELVVMYSGNLSRSHPLDTFLEAAAQLAHRRDIRFVFVGGGGGRPAVEAFAARHPNAQLQLLPYQPLDRVHESLSAADIHLVSMGDRSVGIVHPCKVYGAMGVSRPVLYAGPAESHIGDILGRFDIGWSLRHGEVGKAASLLTALADGPREALAVRGASARKALDAHFAREHLLAAFCDML